MLLLEVFIIDDVVESVFVFMFVFVPLVAVERRVGCDCGMTGGMDDFCAGECVTDGGGSGIF